jgi:hypothetical protein
MNLNECIPLEGLLQLQLAAVVQAVEFQPVLPVHGRDFKIS